MARIELLEAKFRSLTAVGRWAIILGIINLLVKLILPFGIYPPP